MTALAPALRVDSIEIRMAAEADNDSLLALTRMTPMEGTIALRIDRDPDFFALLRSRGNAVVFVAVQHGEVIACVSVAIQQVYVGGAAQSVAYLGDLKVHPRFAGTRVVLQLLAALRAHVERHGVDLVWLLVAEGNARVMPFFGGRVGISRFVSAGRFIVDELLASPCRGARRMQSMRQRRMIAKRSTICWTTFHRSRARATSTPRTDDAITVLVARDGARVVATLELFDPSRLKRNVLLGAPLITRMLLGALRPLNAAFAAFAAFSGPPIPRIGEAVRMAYIRRFACTDLAALTALVHRARLIALRHHFTFVAIGLHERDPLRRIVRGIPRFSFTSLGFVTSLRGSCAVDRVATGIPLSISVRVKEAMRTASSYETVLRARGKE